MNELIGKLIEASPYGGFVLLVMLCMNRVYKGYRKDLKETFDKALESIQKAYETATR